MRRVAAAVLLGTSIAHAEVEAELHEGLTRKPTGPLLDVDLVLQPFIGAVDVETTTERFDIDLGWHTRATSEQSTWNTQFLNGNGWSAELRLVHDFKLFQVGAHASFHRIDSAFQHGSYTIIGGSITRTVQLSKSMTGWISLGVGRLRWRERPELQSALQRRPKEEEDSNFYMLTIGTTF